MTSQDDQEGFTPSGFFVLRTPLLPWDAVTEWSSGLEAPGTDSPALDGALERDRSLLRARLKEIVVDPVAREALFLASPDLESQLDKWLINPDSEAGQKIEKTLVRYFARMAGRPTPFGLFSGCSVGTIGDTTSLQIEGRDGYRRHTRLDMDYVFAVVQALSSDPRLKLIQKFRPNSSLYRAGGRLHFAEAKVRSDQRFYDLVAVEVTEYLEATLSRAEKGATVPELAASLVRTDADISQEEAEEYVLQLVDSQLLVPELSPIVTGEQPVPALIRELGQFHEMATIAGGLQQVQSALNAMDARGPGGSPEQYREIANSLQNLPAQVQLQRLFQVDMTKSAPNARLGSEVLTEIMRGVHTLQRIAPKYENSTLVKFKEAFVRRYEEQEVALAEALDDELGIGYAGSDNEPLLQNLAFPGTANQTVTWNRREEVLLGKLNEALALGSREIRLTDDDLERMARPERVPLSGAFAVGVSVAASSDPALANGEFQVYIQGAQGPSGARMLGRFCHADPQLEQHVREHLRAEEALDDEAVFAEIVHLPQGRVGNLLLRPVLRQYEIPFLGRSGAAEENRIPITDLMVSVKNGQIILRSRKLGRRVIPRMTNAHNFRAQGLGVYKFLCDLQEQDCTMSLNWSWGPLQASQFLPRVVHGRTVLALATWLVRGNEIKLFSSTKGAELYRAVQLWRQERKLPRFVLLQDGGDHHLPVDLDNILSIESFIHMVRNRPSFKLAEMFPDGGSLCTEGPEGRYVHELVIPFVKSADEGVMSMRPGRAPALTVATAVRRSFPPGSEWLYAKIYTGTATADQVLCDVIKPVSQRALATGAANCWFFIRYFDPDFHLRVRFCGEPQRLLTEVLPDLQRALTPFQEDGRVWRSQLDTYEREIERYGGPAGIGLAEAIFQADSEAVLSILESFQGGQRADSRWRLALSGMDALLSDLGLDLPAKAQIMQVTRHAFGEEFKVTGPYKGLLGDKFRREKKALERVFDATWVAQSPLAAGVAAIRRRSQVLQPVMAELNALARSGQLTIPVKHLATSYLHMHANRLLRAKHRAQELVLYDFQSRLYESMLARGGMNHG